MENKINLSRVILGGIAGGIVMLVIGAVIHGMLLEPQYNDMMQRGIMLPEPRMGGLIHHLVVVLSGIVLAYLYAVSRKHSGPGPKTALMTGFLVGLMGFGGAAAIYTFENMGVRIPVFTGIEHLLSCTAGTFVAGWLYKD